jgi:hypothetical protein
MKWTHTIVSPIFRISASLMGATWFLMLLLRVLRAGSEHRISTVFYEVLLCRRCGIRLQFSFFGKDHISECLGECTSRRQDPMPDGSPVGEYLFPPLSPRPCFQLSDIGGYYASIVASLLTQFSCCFPPFFFLSTLLHSTISPQLKRPSPRPNPPRTWTPSRKAPPPPPRTCTRSWNALLAYTSPTSMSQPLPLPSTHPQPYPSNAAISRLRRLAPPPVVRARVPIRISHHRGRVRVDLCGRARGMLPSVPAGQKTAAGTLGVDFGCH